MNIAQTLKSEKLSDLLILLFGEYDKNPLRTVKEHVIINLLRDRVIRAVEGKTDRFSGDLYYTL